VGGGIAPRYELAVIPDKTVAVGHRHNGIPLMSQLQSSDSSFFRQLYEGASLKIVWKFRLVSLDMQIRV
jgi:hypothetical protein